MAKRPQSCLCREQGHLAGDQGNVGLGMVQVSTCQGEGAVLCFVHRSPFGSPGIPRPGQATPPPGPGALEVGPVVFGLVRELPEAPGHGAGRRGSILRNHPSLRLCEPVCLYVCKGVAFVFVSALVCIAATASTVQRISAQHSTLLHGTVHQYSTVQHNTVKYVQ